MSTRRWIILAVAVVVGLLAAGLVYNYVQGVEDDANEDVVLLEVFKVVQEIPKGTFADQAIDNGWIVKEEIQSDFRPANAITDDVQIRGKVAIANLAVNQIVVADLFASQSETLSTFSDLLAENEVAISISVDQIRGVAGLLVPGDYVNVLLSDPVDEGSSANTGDIDADEADPEANADAEVPTVCLDRDASFFNIPDGEEGLFVCPSARYLYQKVQILAIGQQRALQPGETVATNPDGSPVVQNTGLLTLAVPVDAAQWIASVSGSQIYLALVAPDYEPQETGPLTPVREFPSEVPDQLTPYGPDGKESATTTSTTSP